MKCKRGLAWSLAVLVGLVADALHGDAVRWHFADVSESAGVPSPRAADGSGVETFSAAAADFDGDGQLDLFANQHHTHPSYLLRNTGGLVFEDVAKAAGITDHAELGDLYGAPDVTAHGSGFFIWHDPGWEDAWQIRWSGAGQGRTFEGRIHVLVPHPLLRFRGVRRVPVRAKFELEVSPALLSFRSTTRETQGISFKLPPALGLRFELLEDGQPVPGAIHVGADGRSPGAATFDLWTGDRHGVAWGDYDNDGDADLFIDRGAALGRMQALGLEKTEELFRNEGDGRFSHVSASAGIAPNSRRSRGAAWVDVDVDGDLDLVAGSRDAPLSFYENRGGGRFAPRAVALLREACPTFTWFDADGDLDPDLFLPGCSGRRDDLFLNEGSWSFRHVSGVDGVESASGRGMELARSLFESSAAYPADVDNDGDTDLFVTGRAVGEPNRILENDGNGHFEQAASSEALGVGPVHGACFGDVDNDGDVDLYVAHATAGAERASRLYLNDGSGSFRDATRQLGLHLAPAGGGGLLADFDSDGFLDLFAYAGWRDEERRPGATERAQRLFRNTGRDGHWLKLVPRGRASNRDGRGARIRVTAGDLQQLQVVGEREHGRFSQSLLPVHFGLGAGARRADVEILWPSGVRQRLQGVAADQRLVVEEPAGPIPE